MIPTRYQALISALGFSIGVRCDESMIHAIECLESRAEILASEILAREAVRQLKAYFADSSFVIDLPLRPSGTVFQRCVWAQISAIPKRQTRTYGELAKILRSAPRAIGQACGANPFPIAVPCHRVIAADGELGGFARQRSGLLVDIKHRLLAHEGC